ncbi:MAG: hypothetical protein KDK39_05505 [Leptospiraceae bacterium]|nr:hypothetical protein [Leptospiraceae bacterium]
MNTNSSQASGGHGPQPTNRPARPTPALLCKAARCSASLPALALGGLLLFSGCFFFEPTNKDCHFREGDNGCLDAFVLTSLALNGFFNNYSCPPPLTYLTAGTHTFDTGGSNYSVYFTFPQTAEPSSYTITVYESAGQNVGLLTYKCLSFNSRSSTSHSGSETVSQAEAYTITGDSSTFYDFILIGAQPSNEINFKIE